MTREMLGYSGYLKHSHYITPHETWKSAYDFLTQLALKSGENEFAIGELHKGERFGFVNLVWYKWNEEKGEWIERV